MSKTNVIQLVSERKRQVMQGGPGGEDCRLEGVLCCVYSVLLFHYLSPVTLESPRVTPGKMICSCCGLKWILIIVPVYKLVFKWTDWYLIYVFGYGHFKYLPLNGTRMWNAYQLTKPVVGSREWVQVVFVHGVCIVPFLPPSCFSEVDEVKVKTWGNIPDSFEVWPSPR